MGLPAEKRDKLVGLVKEVAGYKKLVPHKPLKSVAHNLAEASTVVLRGKLYVSGLFAALKLVGASGEECHVTRWLERNLRWWKSYLESGAKPISLLIWPPCLEQKYFPHTDASTSFGYGG